MPKDGLRPLPDDIVAPLMRALATLRPQPESRLFLHRAERGRPPDWDASTDYNVMFRSRHVGRIWRSIYKGAAWQDYPWHWKINVPDEADIDWGHSMTLLEAMEHFRRAWDAHSYKQAIKRTRD